MSGPPKRHLETHNIVTELVLLDDKLWECEAKLKAVKDECTDCRDSWAPDHPPHDLRQFLIDLESVFEQEPSK
jgi:hypothetical protein